MAVKWHYNEVLPQIKNREAMQGEFFSSGSTIKGLIREAIQNSLDAKHGNAEGPVRIRIHFSGNEQALLPSDMSHFLSGAWEHYRAEGNGLLV